MPPLLFRAAKIQRWQFYLRHLDLDLAQVDVEWLVEQRRHHDREGDHDRHHDRLQADPGQRAPIDVGALHFLGRDAAQIEQRKAERRMQERGLHVDAEHDAEPDQRRIRPHHWRQYLLRNRRNHGQDDEGDLEEVEEERQEEDEEIDEDQEAPDAAGKRGQMVLEPDAAGDAEEHHREAGRSDQDEDHHGGEAHGRLVALLDQVAQVGDADGLEAEPDDGEIDRRERQFEQFTFAEEYADDRADA